jgi:hypothetical protein
MFKSLHNFDAGSVRAYIRQRCKRGLDLDLHLLQKLPPVWAHKFALDAPVVEVGVGDVDDHIFGGGGGCGDGGWHDARLDAKTESQRWSGRMVLICDG